jgi:hypothetical protein
MGAPWNVWDWDYLWHFLLGAVASAAIVGLMVVAEGPSWVPFLMVPLLLFGGVLREQQQHEDQDGYLTAHQWLEGVLWGVGGLIPALVGLVIL